MMSGRSLGVCGPSLSGKIGLTLITPCRKGFSISFPTMSAAYACSAFRDPREYLKHVMQATNMSCLTPEGATSGECDFLSVNMYARSLFGASYSLLRWTSVPLISDIQVKMHWPI